MKDTIVIPVAALRRMFVMPLVLIALILVILVVRTQLFRAGITSLFAPSAAARKRDDAWICLCGGDLFRRLHGSLPATDATTHSGRPF